MVCYLDRAQRLPMVPVSVCLASDLEECYAWGRSLAEVARESDKRVGLAASGSLSHKLVRGPEKGPSPEDQEQDHRFARMLAAGEYDALWRWLPEFAAASQPEMGGRHLAMMLGAIMESVRLPPGPRLQSLLGRRQHVISLLAQEEPAGTEALATSFLGQMGVYRGGFGVAGGRPPRGRRRVGGVTTLPARPAHSSH